MPSTGPEEKLEEIYNLVSDYEVSGRDFSVSTYRLIQKIKEVVTDIVTNQEQVKDPEGFIICSCDASIKNNPGGPASIGAIIRIPDQKEPVVLSREVPANTNNEAEYDAIYEALVYIADLVNKPKHPIIVRSDSQLVVKQLKGEYKTENEVLNRKRESIHELAAALPVPVLIEWHPRNSTPDLAEANFTAQKVIGVKPH